MTRKPDQRETSKPSLSRRTYLGLAGASIPIVGGINAFSESSSAQTSSSGPPDPDAWNLTFEDTFTGSSLDTDTWEVGFGWGTETNNSAESISADHVNVTDDRLHISATSDDGVEAGCINSKGTITYGPGTYIEARLRPPKRTGFLPAFWGKPDSEAWPPELDFLELFQDGSGSDDWTTACYNVHYSTSTEPGDGSTHESDPTHYQPGSDLTQDFHVYGCKWLTDRVEWYFDGEKVGESTDATAMEALQRGAPFYMMLNIHVDKIGTTDKSETWDEELVVDWVRLWDQSGDGGSSTGDTDETQDDQGSSQGENYFWGRSGDGNTVSFEFEASGGNISLHAADSSDDFWVADDGTTAGGTTAETGGLPGFWFDGEIEWLEYDGALDLYVNDEPADPDQYGEKETDDTTRHYFWANTANDDTVSFEFEASGGEISIDGTDPAADYWVDGTTAGGRIEESTWGLPGFWYYGEIERLQYDGEMNLYIDDQSVDPDQYVDGETTDEETTDEGTKEPLSRSLTFDGDGSGLSYEASVTEQIQATESIESGDSVSESSVTGTVDGGTDEYTFEGVVSELAADDGVSVSIDGTAVKRVRIERASGSSGTVSYLLETSGRVLPAASTTESDDDHTDSKVLGTVSSDADAYWLVDGDLTDVSTFRGDVVATVDGETVASDN